MPNQTPIPTQINIAPSGMTWKNWKLVHGTDGFPTRETMEKYLCNPDRVRDLEECRDLNLQTIKQLEALIQLYEAQMEAVGAGGVEPLRKRNKLHQIAEPDAQHLQELAAYRFTVENLQARVAELEAQLAESTHPTQQGLDDRDVFERAYAEHAIAYAGLDAHVDDVVQRVKDGRDGNSYKHLHDSGAWVGWNLALAAQAKQGGASHG